MRRMFCSPQFGCAGKRGFTLTEIAVVLGIIGIVLGAIWLAASRVYTNKSVTRTVQEVLALANGLSSLYPNGSIQGGAQLLSPLAVNNGIALQDMIGACPASSGWGASYGGTAGCLLDPWGKEVIAGTQNGWGGLPAQAGRFEIGLENLSASQCPQFLAVLVPAAATGGLVEVAATTGLAATTVSVSTSPLAFAGCSGNVYLQFQL